MNPETSILDKSILPVSKQLVPGVSVCRKNDFSKKSEALDYLAELLVTTFLDEHNYNRSKQNKGSYLTV
jgi:hypothetical protein